MSAPGLAFSPLMMVGLEGLYGTVLMSLIVMPAVAFLPGPEGVVSCLGRAGPARINLEVSCLAGGGGHAKEQSI